MNLWINAIFYQATWLAAVAGAGHGRWWAGPIAAALFAAIQLPRSPVMRADALLIAAACVLGFCVDSLLAQSNLIRYTAAVPWQGFAPAWIVALWASFALTLNHSLKYLQRHPAVAALLGAAGGPLAYYAAATGWSALSFPQQAPPALAAVALAWALAAPLLCLCARYLCEHSPATPALLGAPR